MGAQRAKRADGGIAADRQGGTPLELLLVEDSEDDAELVIRQLRRGGYAPRVRKVKTRAEFLAALADGAWHIVVSDHTLPEYSGLSALADLKGTGRDIPFILVSGTIGEAVAVTAMKAGAQDYVLKGDLTRLPVAVERELREAAVRAEQARMREQLVISERMASAGMLAAGVAHEINNPLAAALANLDYTAGVLSRLRAAGDDPGSDRAAVLADLDDPLRDMREALLRIRDIVRDVKVFSRPQDAARAVVDVQRALDSSARMAWNETRHRARLVKDYAPAPAVHANESRLGQVLLNLIVNAAHAIAEGRADENEIRLVTRTDDRARAVIEIHDTGSGIAPENLERIFDPFFTTKPAGDGTGLGLAICRRIVAELGGEIEVESVVGRGTVFRVVLPGVARSDAPVAGNVPVSPASPKRRLRVLIVDDEEAVARSIERGLSRYHDVQTARRARDAVARIASGERFDAIVSDLMMPEVTGAELFEQVCRIDAAQARRIVFLTGGAFTAAARAFLEKVPNPRLEKPFDVPHLLAAIAALAPADVAV